MNFIETTGLALTISVGLLLVAGVIRSRLNSSRKVIPPPKFDIGSLVDATSAQSSPYKARIATRNWHYAEQSYFYVLEGKSKIYLENELKLELINSDNKSEEPEPRGIALDVQTVLDQVRSESMRTLLSIHDHKTSGPQYFDRYRAAVERAIEFFEREKAPSKDFLEELRNSTQIIRNEAYVFEGRTPACLEMADWLEAQQKRFENSFPN